MHRPKITSSGTSLLNFPADMFHLRQGEKPMYGESPNCKRAVDYFKSLITPEEWSARRGAIAKQFYQGLIGEDSDPSGKGKYFDDRDLFGWYLFLAESLTDHPWNYEIVYGCRVIPIFVAIGMNLDLLLKMDGFSERATRAIGSARSQPNGPLFEILVAAAYAREGAKVAFKLEMAGQSKSHDLDINLNGKDWAVECKRMEGGEYHEGERQRMRDLWKQPCFALVRNKRDAIMEVSFKIELKDVPDKYLLEKVGKFIGRSLSAHIWDDRIAEGSICNLDLEPIQQALKDRYLLHPSSKFTQLLTGSYQRAESMLAMMSLKPASNPHFIESLGSAVVCRWVSHSEDAVEKKARDIMKRLSDANEQLPSNVAGVVHIGFEALGADLIEQRRYEKIIDTARKFDRGSSGLEVIYCNYFAPDPAPDEVWAIDETVQWIGRGRPLKDGRLLPSDSAGRSGVHWITPN
jgi:hypothetical protein